MQPMPWSKRAQRVAGGDRRDRIGCTQVADRQSLEGTTMPESLARQAATSARAQKRSDANMHQGAEEERVTPTPMNQPCAGYSEATHGLRRR